MRVYIDGVEQFLPHGKSSLNIIVFAVTNNNICVTNRGLEYNL